MIYSSLDSSHRDESNDSKIIPIGAIFAEIAIFAKFRVGSGRVGYPDHGSKFGALFITCNDKVDCYAGQVQYFLNTRSKIYY